MKESNIDFLNEEEEHLLAKWHGEASSIWWNASDETRALISSMTPDEIFAIGWKACKSYT